MKIALIRAEVLWHLLSRPFCRTIERSAESMKHVKSVPWMVSAYVTTAQRSPTVSKKMCGNANFKSVGENTHFWSAVDQKKRVGDGPCRSTPM